MTVAKSIFFIIQKDLHLTVDNKNIPAVLRAGFLYNTINVIHAKKVYHVDIFIVATAHFQYRRRAAMSDGRQNKP